jgi:hypothetical protein
MFPKKGKVFPGGDFTGPHQLAYAAAIAEALRGNQGDTHQAIKTVMGWTGANERTVKNWFAGTNGPSGEHLVSLAFHSNSVLEAFLRISGREGYAAAFKLIEARDKLIEMLALIQILVGKMSGSQDDGK